jgi:tRNA A37 threonylcarbamoyladenosine biosynthesis protein TsaE
MGVADGVLAIEWPERLAHAMPNAIFVGIEITGDTDRRISILRPGA